MDLQLSKINGTNPYLDYDLLHDTIAKEISKTCYNAEVIVLNNFPVSVSAQAIIDFIIILRVPNLEKNYFKVKLEDDHTYIRSLIIPVSVINEYENSKINLDGNNLEIEDAIFDLKDTATKLKWALTNYLADSCGLVREKITVNPIFWVQNNSISVAKENVIISKDLTFDLILECITKNYYFKYSGYSNWNNSEFNFDQDVKNIFEQASKDSSTGFITRKKIERIQQRFDLASKKAFDNIGSKLVEVSGKAGTGKSSDILKWMLNLSLVGRKGVFLTYNHLLVFDISGQIQNFINQLSVEDRTTKMSTSTDTLHAFFYNVAKKLGVLMLMSEKRIKELKNILDNRWLSIEAYLDTVRDIEPEISLSKLLHYVQSKSKFDEGTKREAINFIQQVLKHKFLADKEVVSIWFKDFRETKIKKLSNLENSNIFLKDYHKVLERILQALNDLEGFLTNLDVASKFDLLENVMDLNPNILMKDRSGRIDFEKLKTRYKKGISGFKAGRIVFVDEAQDCHPYERDILYGIFGPKNVVTANGDKEQLIRYSQLCNWHISMAKSIDFYRYTKKKQSFRMKPAIAALANHVARTYNIDLEILPLDTEDHGSVIVSKTSNIENEISTIQELYIMGERQGCTPYEALLLMKPADKPSKTNSNSKIEKSVVINEFDNIIESNEKSRNEWELIKVAEPLINDFRFWNATGNIDKREQNIPGALSVRSIYYESCRGIEAWSIMCFGLDDFFLQKVNAVEADNYLLNDLFDQLTPTKRKEMYAATWVLMAITRAIDTCYIEVTNKESSLYKCIENFAIEFPDYVTK